MGSMSDSIVLIRSGATAFDLEQRIRGTLDMPLCDEGLREAEHCAEMLELANAPISQVHIEERSNRSKQSIHRRHCAHFTPVESWPKDSIFVRNNSHSLKILIRVSGKECSCRKFGCVSHVCIGNGRKILGASVHRMENCLSKPLLAWRRFLQN